MPFQTTLIFRNWKNSSAQTKQVALLSSRVDSWSLLMKDSIVIISKMLKAHSHSSKAFNSIVGRFKDHEELSGLKNHLTLAGNDTSTLALFIKDNGVQPLKDLRKQVAVDSKTLKKSIGKEQKKITKSRDAIVNLVFSSKKSGNDVWIDQTVIKNSIATESTDETHYQKELLISKNRIKQLDAEIHEKLLGIVNVITKSAEVRDSVLPFKNFEEVNQITDDPWTELQETTIYSLEDIAIEKEGLLQRKSSFRKIWKSAHFVLTSVRNNDAN